MSYVLEFKIEYCAWWMLRCKVYNVDELHLTKLWINWFVWKVFFCFYFGEYEKVYWLTVDNLEKVAYFLRKCNRCRKHFLKKWKIINYTIQKLELRKETWVSNLVAATGKNFRDLLIYMLWWGSRSLGEGVPNWWISDSRKWRGYDLTSRLRWWTGLQFTTWGPCVFYTVDSCF